jgi:hypothetical protein
LAETLCRKLRFVEMGGQPDQAIAEEAEHLRTDLDAAHGAGRSLV